MESDSTGKWETFEVNDNEVLKKGGFHLIMLLIALTLLIYLAHKLQNGWMIQQLYLAFGSSHAATNFILLTPSQVLLTGVSHVS